MSGAFQNSAFQLNAFQTDGDVVVTTPSTGGAGPGARRRRHFVKIDGQEFEVGSATEAFAVLELARTTALEAAKAQAAAKVATEAKPKQKPTRKRKSQSELGAPPQIEIGGEWQPRALQAIEEYGQRVRAAFEAAFHAELARLRAEAYARAQEDEDVAMLMLHHDG